MADWDVIIVGGGVSGLACALALCKSGKRVRLLERMGAVGGRVRTDRIEGFALDHGFQVLLTAYPTCRDLLDFGALDLGRFEPGASVHLSGRDYGVTDPFRRPLGAFATLAAPIGSISDKLRIARLRQELVRMPMDAVWKLEEQTTLSYLRGYGFSDCVIDAFFRPFLSGIFLERELTTSCRMFAFVYKCFSMGAAALPAGGMQAIPRQMATRLPRGTVRTHAPVRAVGKRQVVLETGETLESRAVVVATDGSSARRWFPELPKRGWTGGTCYYFASTETPLPRTRVLWLNGTGAGRVNHIAVPSAVAREYAPKGKYLISVNTLGGYDSADGEAAVRADLGTLFGEKFKHWEFLRAYPVPRSLPKLEPGTLDMLQSGPKIINGIHLCGDLLREGSLEGAMASGVAAAGAVIGELDQEGNLQRR